MTSKNMAKMSRSNVKARKWMEANGYDNIFLFQHHRWSKDAHIILGDIDVEFDGFATRKNSIVFFQIKSNCRCPKKTLQSYNTLAEIFKCKFIWVNSIDRKGLEINNIPSHSWKTTQ